MTVLRTTLAAIALTVFVAACTSEPTELGQGDKAPAWTGTTFRGDSVQFPELLDGKPAVMVFWATWCGYCRAFMPHLKSIQNEYRDAINIVTINAKEDGAENPATYISRLNFPMIAVRNGDAIAAAYDVEYIPGLMVADADGVVAYRRAWTELPAGEEVAIFWAAQVRIHLDSLLR